MTEDPTHALPAAPRGLGGWMTRVLVECERAGQDLVPDSVHGLRVALRRCRSIAGSLERFDDDPDWRALRRAAKPLFSELGELRDVHVVLETANRIAPPDDPALPRLLARLQHREDAARERARKALDEFERKKWKGLSRRLPRRTVRLRPAAAVYETLAVEQWLAAAELHRRALVSRSRVAWHRLRVGIKRFRYVVENFLPRKYESWGEDLRRLQDLLGEVHDLDVLWSELLRLRPMVPEPSRHAWSERIETERGLRLAEYREKATGADSVWIRWREGLPDGAALRSASLERLAAWGAFHDPHPAGARNRRRLALDLAQGLYAAGLGEVWGDPEALRVLEAAALLQDVGRAHGKRRRQKRSRERIRKLVAPPGWIPAEIEQVALVVRYHRGAEPDLGQRAYRRLDDAVRRRVTELAAVLRLTNALDPASAAKVLRVDIDASAEVVRVIASGYEPSAESAGRIARAKHLLERVVGRAIAVVPRSSRPRLALVPRPPGGVT